MKKQRSRSVLSVFALSAAACLLAAPTPAQEPLPLLTTGQMEQDLFTLSGTLERLHAGRLRYASAGELDEDFGEALHAVSEERDVLEYFRIVSRVVSSIRCGHTSVHFPGSLEQRALTRAGMLPIEVHLSGERAWIVRVLDEACPLEPGQEILEINGRSLADIRRVAFELSFGDGFIETRKERELERNFAKAYVMLVQTPAEVGRPYALLVAGESEPVAITGIAPAAFAARRAERPQRPLMELELRPDQDLAILRVSEFGDRSGEPPFPEQLDECFVRVNETGLGHLALDLRGNSGGDDNYGALLVSYMAARRFEYFDHIQVTAEYEGPGGIVERDGRRLVTQHRSLQPWDPAEQRFEGKVYLLTDGWTFSTAADVATVAHHNDFAELVGEETGGGYDGNTSGMSTRLILTHSGLSVNVPQWMYTTANSGHAYAGRGAIPEHAVRPTIEERLEGRDAALAAVLKLVQGG